MYAKPRKYQSNQPKKMWVGGAISAGVGLISSVIGGISAKKKAAREQRKAEANQRMDILNTQLQVDNSQSIEEKTMYAIGSPDADLYAKGGNLGYAMPKKLRGNGLPSIPHPMQNTSNEISVPVGAESASQGTNSPTPNLPSQTGLATKGGDLKGLASGTDLAVGNTHEQSTIDNTSGIKVAQNGKVLAEVEDGEVIKEGLVFSDRLKHDGKHTYAKTAESLAKERGKLETQLASVRDRRKRNSLERQISILNTKEKDLYVQQEASKAMEAQANNDGNNVPPVPSEDSSLSGEPTEMAKGGNLLTGASQAGKSAKDVIGSTSSSFSTGDIVSTVGGLVAPFIDNIFNATKGTPGLVAPVIAPIKQMDTNVNVNPQLASIDRAVNASVNNVMTNTNNSSAARNAITNARLKGAAMKGEVYGNKQNTELQLRNQNTAMVNQKLQQDGQVQNQHNMLEYQRRVGMSEKASGNVANVVDDIKGIVTSKKLQRNFDEATFNSIAMDKTGATYRAYMSNPYFLKELEGNPRLREQLQGMAFRTDESGKFVQPSSAKMTDTIYGTNNVATATPRNLKGAGKASTANTIGTTPVTPSANLISTPAIENNLNVTPAVAPVNINIPEVGTPTELATPPALSSQDANARIFDTPSANVVAPRASVSNDAYNEKVNLIRNGYSNLNQLDNSIISKIGESNLTSVLSKVREFTGTNVDFADKESVKRLQKILGTSETGNFTEADYKKLLKLQTK